MGLGATRLKPGDKVFGVTSIPKAGAFAENVVADENRFTLKPPNCQLRRHIDPISSGSAQTS